MRVRGEFYPDEYWIDNYKQVKHCKIIKYINFNWSDTQPIETNRIKCYEILVPKCRCFSAPTNNRVFEIARSSSEMVS
jgi:hypothetical protein